MKRILHQFVKNTILKNEIVFRKSGRFVELEFSTAFVDNQPELLLVRVMFVYLISPYC